MQIINVADNILNLILLFKAGDSHEMPSLIFSKKSKKKCVICCSCDLCFKDYSNLNAECSVICKPLKSLSNWWWGLVLDKRDS